MKKESMSVKVPKNSDDNLIVKPVNDLPSWADLLKAIPEETIKMDADGHYNPKEYLDFSNWMTNG